MATIIEIIKEAEKKYGESVNVQELKEALATLSELPQTRFKEGNLARRNKLIAYLKIKIAVITFFFAKEDLSHRNLDVAKLAMDEGRIILENDVGVEEATWIGSIKDIMTRVAIYFKSVYDGVEAVEQGGTEFNAEKYCETLELVDKKLKEMQENVDFGSPLDLFPLPDDARVNFRFPAIAGTLQSKMRLCRNRLNEFFKNNFFTPISIRNDLAKYDKYELCPDEVIGMGDRTALIQFVSTPLENEFTFLLNANQNVGGKARTIAQLNTGWLSEACRTSEKKADASKRAQEVKNIFYGFFAYVEYEKAPSVFALYGVNDLSESDRQGVFTACSEYAERHKGKIRFVIHDSTGNIALLRAYNELGSDRVKTAASNLYLSLPKYGEVYEALKEIGAEKLAEVKKYGVFLGYIGISVLLRQFRDGDKLWENEYKKTSLVNSETSIEFLDELNEDAYFVPADWHWEPNEGRKPRIDDAVGYDYDQIKEVMNDEIKSIIENPELDIYRRCEQLVIYCLCAGEDVTVWDKLDEEEKEARITTAVKVIATAMRCYYSNPVVEFSKEKSGHWGGACCGGGHTIKFKVSCIQDLKWTRDAILHELYHSVQHTMTGYGRSLAWYKKTYHVSEERRISWQDNDKVYTDIDVDEKSYWVQVKEVDARDFACMCLGDQVYHTTRI